MSQSIPHGGRQFALLASIGVVALLALTLALLPMSVALVIMMVNGSIGTGLAVAGTFALVRFRSVPGTAREIAAIFTAVAMGLAMGMGMLGVAVVFFLLAAAAVLVLTKLHFGAMPENAKVLRITVPEDVDYETALPDVFRAHHVTATLEKVRTESMGTRRTRANRNKAALTRADKPDPSMPAASFSSRGV